MIRKIAKLTLVLSCLLLLSACTSYRPNIAVPAKQPPAAKSNRPIRVALVLGAGGARGYAHLGVLQVLRNAHIPIDLVVGSSVGSTVGALYCDNNSVNQAVDAMIPAGFWTFADMSDFPSPRGLMRGYHLQRFLLDHMRARTFSELKTKLVVATTDLQTGKTYAIQGGPIAPAAAASASIPGVVRTQNLYGHMLVDGGVADPVPVDLAKRYHPQVIIAVNISQQLSKQLPFTAISTLNRSYLISWERLSVFSERGADVKIHPQVGDIGTFAVRKKYVLYMEGVRAAQEALPEIKRLLKEKNIPLTQ